MLLITLGAILILIPLVKGGCQRIGVPSSVGFIVLGLLLGEVVRPWAISTLVFEETFAVFAQLGVVALLFRVGLKSHTRALLDKLPDASLIWVSDVLGSLAVGYLVGRIGLGWPLETSLIVATAFSATSIAVSLSVWDELGLAGTDVSQMLLDVAELDDLSAAVLLAVLAGTLPALLAGGDGLMLEIGVSSLDIVLRLVVFIVGCYLFAHLIEADFTRIVRRLSNAPASLTISILGAGLTIAALAGYLGFSIAIGAFFAGLAFSRDPQAVRTDGSFTYFYDFLTPFFFIHIGMQTELSILLDSLSVGLVLFVAAALAKLVFAGAAALFSMSWDGALRLGVSMIPRAEIALVVIYEFRLIDERVVPDPVFAGMVLVCLVSCILPPIVLRRMLVGSASGGRGES